MILDGTEDETVVQEDINYYQNFDVDRFVYEMLAKEGKTNYLTNTTMFWDVL